MCCLVWVFSRVLCVIFWIQVDVSAYKRLGCYRDNRQEQRPLHHLLFTDREESSPKYSGIKYTKEIYDRRYLDYLIKRCALECKKFGYEVFGIEKFADCYSGDGGLSTYKRDGQARECFTSDHKPCDLTCESQPCAGRNDTIFVYKLEETVETSSTPCFPPIKTTPLTITSATPRTKPTPTKPQAKTATPTSKGTSEGTSKASRLVTKSTTPKTTKFFTTSSLPIIKGTNLVTKPTRRTAGTSPSQPRSVATKSSTKHSSSRLLSSKATIPVTKPTKATPKTKARITSPNSVATGPTKPVVTKHTTRWLPQSSKAIIPVTKATKGTPGTPSKSVSPGSVATKPTRPAVTIRTNQPLPGSKATVPITKVTKAAPRPTAKSTARRSVATKPTHPAVTTGTSKSQPTNKVTVPITKLTKATPGTTVRSASPSFVSTRLTQPTISSQTTIPATKPTTSSNAGKTPGATSVEISRTYPTKASGIPCCTEHPPITLVCAPQCHTSCPAVCPPSCCNALSQQYRGVYSSSALPLKPVYANHCPPPCPSSCAPKCSPKCCNAVIYRSQLYLKRKVIGRKSAKKKSSLRKLGKLHQLKKAVKPSQK